jgi:hypothetical protein
MARFSKGSILSGASGRIGNIVTYNLKGTQVVRTLPETSKKRKLSPLQEQHLYSFKTQRAIAASLKKSIIDRIWSRLTYSGGANAYNQFIKRNCAAYGGDTCIQFPELFIISEGNLMPALNFRAIKEDNMLKFTWNTGETGKYSALSDCLNIMLLTNKISLIIMDIKAIRSEEHAEIVHPQDINGAVEGYAFWSSEDDTQFSPSMYWICR